MTCNDDSLYCGISIDVDRRIEQHNSGKGSKYTRSRRPVEFLISMETMDHSEALKMELEIKSLPKDQKVIYFLEHSGSHKVHLKF